MVKAAIATNKFAWRVCDHRDTHEALANGPSFRPVMRTRRPSGWRMKAPLRPQQISQQANLKLVADIGDDVADVAHDADRSLPSATIRNDGEQDDDRIKRQADRPCERIAAVIPLLLECISNEAPPASGMIIVIRAVRKCRKRKGRQ
jgi:hypothetical protein